MIVVFPIDASSSSTNVTGETISRLKRLPDFKLLHCSSVRGISPLLEKLPVAANLEELAVDDTHLTRMDLRAIAKLKKLRRLSLGGNNEINDEALAELKPLTNLVHLSAIGCPLTEKCVSTLRTFKSLQTLKLSYLNKSQLQHLKAALKDVTIESIGGGDFLVGAEETVPPVTVPPNSGSKPRQKPAKPE